MPALKIYKTKINYKTYTWRFNVGKPAFALKKTKKFTNFFRTAITVYILILLKPLPTKTAPVYFISAVITKVFLPKRLSNYIYVFFNKKAKRLLLHKAYDHAINIINGKPFYKPLYNLSVTKLTQLRNYLNDALKKE